ncbi:MAG TPA: 4-hydroxy-tetrahydrodipicolinate synthase [Candidatus Ozemobacteraceae bacterium]|nr:4-hydroxy-tetrahydrodipicolinate synthase [Candidatus Ozemobacteraceae bacterium]
MPRTTFQGSWAALVTPFHDGQIDLDALYRLLDLHLAAGTDGLVISGTTGESATLTGDEKIRLMETVAGRVTGKIGLMFGTGGNSTAAAVEMTRRAESLGADSVLVVTPYYNKPTPAGQIAHYQAVAAATKLPVLLYNVPGRTGTNMTAATVLELAKVPNIRGIKEASGNIEQAMDILRAAPAGFELVSGEDALNLPLMAVGARGTISVTANVAPRLMKEFVDAALRNTWDEARRRHFELLDLHRAMFYESNPIPCKTALALMGLIRDEFRLPLVPATGSTRDRLAVVLEKLGLLPS